MPISTRASCPVGPPSSYTINACKKFRRNCISWNCPAGPHSCLPQERSRVWRLAYRNGTTYAGSGPYRRIIRADYHSIPGPSQGGRDFESSGTRAWAGWRRPRLRPGQNGERRICRLFPHGPTPHLYDFEAGRKVSFACGTGSQPFPGASISPAVGRVGKRETRERTKSLDFSCLEI